MSLKIGIVGLPNVGKSTLFHALTQKKVDISNYPFCTIEPNVGVVPVPDQRLNGLASLSRSKKVIPAVVEFVDIAGLVKGAAGGEGLGNKFLSHIKEVDAIAEVVRVFEDGDIIHVANTVNPLSDIEVLEYELILKDLETASRRLESLRKDAKIGEKGVEEELARLRAIEENLKSGQKQHTNILDLPAGQVGNVGMLSGLQLLSEKPIIYVFNASEAQIQNHWQPARELMEKIGQSPFVIISAKVESDLSDMPEEEKKEYLDSLGQSESGLNRLIKTGYKTLGLITFFTTPTHNIDISGKSGPRLNVGAGEDETRAWTIPAGSAAPRAGRAIHSDFEEKFIRAEVINWEKLIKAGSWSKARDLGRLRIEGKEYIVQDGDVMLFRI